jgi:uncharacterized protein YegL
MTVNNNLVDITIVLDRSGSMGVCREEAESGLNAFVDEQKALPGDANLTLITFNNHPKTVFNGRDIKSVEKLSILPQGMTALYDAIGTAIAEAGQRFEAMKAEDIPGGIVFVILTDGEENASHEFTLPQIKAMITHQQDKYGWKFVFLGANQDTFKNADAMGINANTTADYSVGRSAETMSFTSAMVGAMRSQVKSGAPVAMAYSISDRKGMVDND